MAIKLPNPGNGIPEQKTGNDEWTNMQIVRENFADKSNAASRLVGSGADQVPTGAYAAASTMGNISAIDASVDLNTLTTPNAWTAFNMNPKGDPVIKDYGQLLTLKTSPTSGVVAQVYINGYTGEISVRRTGGGNNWGAWQAASKNALNYSLTTGTAPNVVVEADGTLKRSSSSEKYKKILSKLELDEGLYQKAMQVKPVIYRSKAESDPQDWHYMSFLAEELGELDPSLTQWLVKTHDDEGNELEEPIKDAEGINLNAICAMLHATNVYQGKKLKELEQRLTSLEQIDEPTI